MEDETLTETTEGGKDPEEAGGEHIEGEHAEGEHVEGEHVEGEHVEGEHVEVEHVEGEHIEGEHVEGQHVEGEHVEGEHVEGVERVKGEEVDGEHIEGEELIGEGLEGEQTEAPTEKKEETQEFVEEEEVYVEEPPPDPTAPYDLSESKELLLEPFELRPDQLAEVETLWEYFQNYTPAYTNIDNYITPKELIYMLKSLNLMTHTPEQFLELIDFCARPPHPKGHITYEQFLRIVTIRQRSLPIEEELRIALQTLDPERTGTVDREYFKTVVSTMGNKLPQKQLDFLVKEVDISNDGTLGIEDIVGTMCIDLNTDDIIMLRTQLNPDEYAAPLADDDEE